MAPPESVLLSRSSTTLLKTAARQSGPRAMAQTDGAPGLSDGGLGGAPAVGQFAVAPPETHAITRSLAVVPATLALRYDQQAACLPQRWALRHHMAEGLLRGLGKATRRRLLLELLRARRARLNIVETSMGLPTYDIERPRYAHAQSSQAGYSRAHWDHQGHARERPRTRARSTTRSHWTRSTQMAGLRQTGVAAAVGPLCG